MEKYNFQVFIPGGNDTALVFGLEADPSRRKSINDSIMCRFPNVEQVGFLSNRGEPPELFMAGGEFCGNATRSAAWYYLGGKPGEIVIRVSGVANPLHAGVSANGDAWAEMPVKKDLDDIQEVDKGHFLVNLEGISHLIVMPEVATGFNLDSEALKNTSYSIMKQYKLLDKPASGVIILEKIGNATKIHPCVRVAAIDTMFYETACGSGTIATGLVFAYISGNNVEIPLIQPSEKRITASVEIDGLKVTKAQISGPIVSDNIVYSG